MANNNFFYKRGTLETTIPWEKPSKEQFQLWLNDFFTFENVQNYRIWLCGGFLEQKWETWDIDIILTGPLIICNIEKLLIDGIFLGLYKYNILIDLQYCVAGYNWPFKKPKKITKIVNYDKIIKNNQVLTDLTLNPSFKQISNKLWQVTAFEPSEKQMKRILIGETYDKEPQLLTQDTQFI